MSHEESAFFALFFALIGLLWLFKADRAQLRFALWLALPVLLAFLANERRAGMLVLMLAAGVIAVMGFVLLPWRRRRLVGAGILAAALLVPYVLAFHASDALIAEPASALGSVVWPDPRDEGSNTYRVIEAEIVALNIALSPIVGLGYGREMVMFLHLPDLTDIFEFWAWIPHNTIMWVWMRLGIIGFAAFWFMIGRSVVGAAVAARQTRDRYLQAVLAFAIIVCGAWVTQGAVDMGLTTLRLNVLVALAMGLVARMETAVTHDRAGGFEPAIEDAAAPTASGRTARDR
jgi:O-antigen ligase